MIRAFAAIVLLVLAGLGSAWPQALPAEEARLHEQLHDPDPARRAAAERGLWTLWMRSGDAVIDADLERGTQLMQAGVLGEAIEVFSAVVRRRPEFAEGWNKRATAYYLAGDDERSIADCLEVLRRKPKHFGALSGMGLLHARREDYAGALAWFRRALDVNPNMEGVRENIRELEALLKRRTT
jgi:Flp pilus assembly protein TadD